MNRVKWTDDQGYKHVSLTLGKPEDGMILDLDLSQMDWEAVKRDLHNRLVEKDLLKWQDVMDKGGLQSAIVSAVKPHLIQVFKKASKDYGSS